MLSLEEKMARLPKKIDGFTLSMGVTKCYGVECFYCGYLMPRFIYNSNGEDCCHYNCNDATFYSDISIANAVDYVYDYLVKKGVINDK